MYTLSNGRKVSWFVENYNIKMSSDNRCYDISEFGYVLIIKNCTYNKIQSLLYNTSLDADDFEGYYIYHGDTLLVTDYQDAFESNLSQIKKNIIYCKNVQAKLYIP